MPYDPYWFEFLDGFFPWLVPFIAFASLWVARLGRDERIQRNVERVYFASMLIVAAITLRTILADDGCWILHTGSLGFMVLAAAMPKPESAADEYYAGHVEF